MKSLLNKESITIIFVLGILVLVSSGVVVYMNFRDQEDYQDYSMISYNRITLLNNIYSGISEAESLRRNYFTSSEKQYLAGFKSTAAVIDSLFIRLKQYPYDDSDQQGAIDTLKSLVSARIQIFKDGIELQSSRGTNPKIHAGNTEKGRVVQSDIRNLINRLKAEELETLDKKNELASKGYWFTFYTIIGATIIGCLIFIFVFVSIKTNASKIFDSESGEITKQELEQIVRERMVEISQINQKLYQKIDLLEKTENALKQSEQYYRMLFEQAHDAIIIFSPEDEKVLDVNQRACEIYGFSKDEFIGLSLKTVSKNVPQGEENIKKTLKTGYHNNFQTVHYRKDYTEML
ncbi:MAG: CHASE3 domain-containing protein, partial [Chlorobi bacterium]|nr:CHASE3 domain-containing protein [Chlorobiota bacterium]